MSEVTRILSAAEQGGPHAASQLLPLVYEELRLLAQRRMAREPAGHTLQTTELIHETYLKLAAQEGRGFENRAHFFGVAAKAMRHILVDHARAKHAAKRGGWQEKIVLSGDVADTIVQSQQILALDEALRSLSAIDRRKSEIVELKYFGGLTNDETAEALNISVETVKRDWRFARSWLLREMEARPTA